LHGCDPAELGQLTATVERILPAIEEFWRYEVRDDAARRRPGWLDRLDVPLPEAGGGIGAVVADLAEVVIPNGARVGEPGWSGFITTGPTTSAVAAWLAAAAAGSQRYAVQVFNTLERVALDWVERHVGFARHVAQLALGHPRLELLHEPELSIVCFRYTASDAVNAEILQRLRRSTRSIPSSTVVGGHLAIRPCFVNPHTQLADVNALVDHVITIGDELTGTQSG